MNILVVDVGGTSVKILAAGHEERRSFPSGPTLTAEQMVARVMELAGDWRYDVVSVGYPGFVTHGRPVAEPAPTWLRVGSASIFRPRSAVPSRSPTTLPCKPWGHPRVASRSSRPWAPAWEPP